MKKKIFSISIFTVVLFVTSSFRENSFIDQLALALDKYTQEFPQEKIYVHFDKPYYTAGETIWFKSYLVAGSYHEPSPFSQTIYIDLFNQEGNPILEFKFKSDKGFAHGHLDLPDTLQSGKYMFRAYTSWMRNFLDDFFFEREIKIWNPGEKLVSFTDVLPAVPDLQFFPEGGNLVGGIQSRVGFKAVGKDGLGRKVKGIISDQHGTFITAFESNQFGMGAFEIIPEYGKTYFSKLDEYDSPEVRLPSVSKNGFVLSVTHSDDDLLIRIQTNESTPDKNVIVVAQCRGVLEYILQPDLSNYFTLVKVPKSKHLNGITQLTLFNGRQIPVAERLFYVDNDEEVNITVDLNKNEYRPREKVSLSIYATDKNSQPVRGNFSLAIVDGGQMELDEDAEHITANLLLSSELTGYIEKAGYYFNPDNVDRKEALDALLLTQGWRRFIWQDALNGKWPTVNHPVEQGLTLSGRLVDVLSKKPISNGQVRLLSNNPDLLFLESSTDNFGRFAFRDLVYYDTANIFLQGVNSRDKKTILIEADLPNKPPINPRDQQMTLHLTPNEETYLERSRLRQAIEASYNFDEKVILLDPVEVTGEAINNEPFKIYGSGSRTLRTNEIPNLESYFHPLQLLRGRVAGVRVFQNNPFNWSVSIRDNFGSNKAPLLFLDNMPVSSSILNGMPADYIESIEVFTGPEAVIFGANGGSGAILFYTKRGAYHSIKRQGAMSFMRPGFQIQREFYSPQYDVPQPQHIKPDFRATVYWNPYVATDSLGRATLNFFTNDNESKMIGVMEGLSYLGTPATGRFTYHVRKD